MDSSSPSVQNADFIQIQEADRGKRKVQDESDGNGVTSKPSKKSVPTRSNVWQHYTRLPSNCNKCTCHYCKKEYSCNTKSGTSNLISHLHICKEYKTWGETQANMQHVITADGLQNAKVTEEKFREATNEMLVVGQLPLAFIESMAWKHFCKKVKLYKPVSRRSATRDIVEMYESRKATLREWFKTNKQRVSLTTDIWTASHTGASYMVTTAHFIDVSWQLKKLIIGFKYVSDHKGKTIANVLLECLVDWGIDKVFCVTVYNVTANGSALREFSAKFFSLSTDALVLDGSYMHVRCCAHIINLIASEGLDKVNESVTAIRNAVLYVRSKTTRLHAFERRVDASKVTRGSLPLDVKTRWNSTYLMLSKAHIYKAAFDRMTMEDKLYNDHFMEHELSGEKRVGPPTASNWSSVEKLTRFLVIFYKATLVVSASSSLNAYKCYGQIVTIATNLKNLACSYDDELKINGVDMLAKLEKYWDGMNNINKMLIVATVFDPRKKMQYAKLCFDELYGKDSYESKALCGSVNDLLRMLFTEYSGRYSERLLAQQSQSQPQSHPSSQSTQLEDSGFGYNSMEDAVFGYKNIDSQ